MEVLIPFFPKAFGLGTFWKGLVLQLGFTIRISSPNKVNPIPPFRPGFPNLLTFSELPHGGWVFQAKFGVLGC